MTLPWRSTIFISLLGTVVALGQTRPERADEPRINLPLSFEAIPRFNVDSSLAVVDFHYRVNHRFFVFVRRSTNADAYEARGELMVELRNDQDVAVARNIRQIGLRRTAQPLEKEILPDIEGGFSFQVPEGEYTIIFSVDDKESGRAFLDRNKKVVARKPLPVALEVSYPMFAQLVNNGPSASQPLFTPANHGTEVTFGSNGGLLYQLYLPPDNVLQVHWKIQRQRGVMFDWFPSFSGDQYTLIGGTLALKNDENKLIYETRPSASSSWRLLYIPLPVEKLDPGGYTIRLELTSGQTTSSKEYSFQVLWQNRPLALLNSQLAIDALRHIATEEELQSLQTSSLDKNIKAFYEFWRKRDPDTTSAYNELLVEYYRRVDEANQRFSSRNEQDGYKTDRGRIYILYGAPTQINKLVPPGEAPTEIWVYDRLKKRFIFTDRSKSGNFYLVATEQL
jgi:GWxTD domain-containing protein